MALVVALAAAGCGDSGGGKGAGTGPQASGGDVGRVEETPAKRTAPAVVWAVGDAADGSAGAKLLADRIGQGRVDHLLYLGDVYERGTSRDFAANYEPVLGRFAKVTSPTPGNHEWPAHRQGYDAYWSAVKGQPQPSYYGLELGGWDVLSLNSEDRHDPGSPQLRWLDERLAGGGSGTCRLAFWHRPRFSASTVHGDQGDVDPLWQAVRGRAAIVLNGHDHDSQRFRPIDGTVELVSGAGRGGEPLYPLHEDPRLAYGNAQDLAAVRLELRPGRARAAFVGKDGRELDSAEIPCRR